VYASRVNFFFGTGRTIRIGGTLLGTDKLGHFFSQGWKYYRRHRRGLSEAAVMRRGAFNERWLFGQARPASTQRRSGRQPRGLTARSLFEDGAARANRRSSPSGGQAAIAQPFDGATTSAPTGTRRSIRRTSRPDCSATSAASCRASAGISPLPAALSALLRQRDALRRDPWRRRRESHRPAVRRAVASGHDPAARRRHKAERRAPRRPRRRRQSSSRPPPLTSGRGEGPGASLDVAAPERAALRTREQTRRRAPSREQTPPPGAAGGIEKTTRRAPPEGRRARRRQTDRDAAPRANSRRASGCGPRQDSPSGQAARDRRNG
jgi:hypothetical protein